MTRFLIPALLIAALGWAGPHAERQTEPVAVPGQFHQNAGAAAAPADLSQWWQSYQDPLLNRLMERALAGNLDLRLALARLDEVRAARGVSRSALLPSVNASTGAQRLRGGFNQGIIRVNPSSPDQSRANLITPFETNLLQGALDMRWELDLFGGLRKRLDAATAEVAVSDELRRDVLVTVSAEVARTYVEWRGWRDRLAIARSTVNAQRETLELTEVRAEAGLATRLDVDRQEATLAISEAVIPQLEAWEAQTLHRLGVLVGEAPGALAAEFEPLAPGPFEVPRIGAGVPSELLKRRPDVRAAEASITAAISRLGAARTDLFPKILLTGQLGRQGTSFPGLTLGAGNFFGFGPALQLPILSGGRIRANIDAEKARLAQAGLQYRQQVLAALEETENALAGLREERRRQERLSTAVAASREALALARELHLKGLETFLAVLDSERQLYAAEDALAQSRTGVAVQSVALFKALGGGWRE